MVFEICAAIATLILAILAYFIIQSLRELQKSLKQVNELTAQLNEKLDPVGQLVTKVNDKLDAVEPIFNSINQLGYFLEEKTSSLTNRVVEKQNLSTQDTINSVIELVAKGVLIWQQIKKRR